jgi:prepilin-type processing-associated H-X9-DG protein
LLVVISIISMLMALLLPAVMNARSYARRATCMNNLRNVGLAMLSETGTRKRFPASGHFSLTGSEQYHSWVVPLLPYLERNDIHTAWNWNLTVDDPANAALTRISVPTLVCPDDFTVVPGQGNLSYVVNAGFAWTSGTPALDCPVSFHVQENPVLAPLDFSGNGNPCPVGGPEDAGNIKLFYQTGLFFLENWPPAKESAKYARYHTLDSILDGTSNTIMLSENLRAGYDPAKGTSWATSYPTYSDFFVSSYVCENRSCAPGKVDYSRANNTMYEGINSSIDQAEGEAPWPSSFHPGGVHVVFVDGHVQFLSEEVAGAVYAALVSPQGASIRGPLAQVVLSDTDY